MKISEKKMSINALYAAALACIFQTLMGVFILLTPFIVIPMVEVIVGESPYFYQIYIPTIERAIQDMPLFIIGVLFTLVSAILLILASKRVKKDRRVFAWSVTAIFVSFFLLNFGRGQITEIAGLLGIVGSVSGLMYRDKESN